MSGACTLAGGSSRMRMDCAAESIWRDLATRTTSTERSATKACRGARVEVRRCGGAAVRRCGGAAVHRCGGMEAWWCGGAAVRRSHL